VSRDVRQQSTTDLQSLEKAARRLLAIDLAKDDLLAFTKLASPDPEDPDDPDRTTYDVAPHHRLIAEALMRVEKGEIKRLAISIGPQFGKSELTSRKFIAWYRGRNPAKHIIFGTYNEDFAMEFGADHQALVDSPVFRAVFQNVKLRKRSTTLLTTSKGGKTAFIGRGGSGTGKPAHLVVIDDPLKNEEEAESAATRKILHGWFSKTIYARARNSTAIVIIHTRWHEDDLIGRLCDPTHPDYDPEVAKEWVWLNIPAVLTPGALAEALKITPKPQSDPQVVKQFGTGALASLWPKEFSLNHLASAKRLNPRGFEGLYMGRPTPEDGEYFKAEWLVEYQSLAELPKNLRYYGASDHAVTEKQSNDPNVVGCIGIDDRNHIWVLPTLVWQHMETDDTVDEIIEQMRLYRPLAWWAENDVIGKAIGPFLIKRMHERQVYTTLDPITPANSKSARARSIQGRMMMKMVHFPAFASWWPEAKSQMLKFPKALHDDFVDWLSYFGLGLLKEYAPDLLASEEPAEVIPVGSIKWIKAAAARERRIDELKKASAGF
jgi:predicted phage terminase large subunit-like protein